ncbi:cupin domain-containing protein [Mucilaginibacter yixingensis]
MKDRVLGKLGFEGQQLYLDNLPATDRYANHLSWLRVLAPLLPHTIETIFMQEIRRDENLSQLLVVSRIDVPEETHDQEAESFFILEGKCACTVGKKIFYLSAGDYLDIPLHIPHDVKLLSHQVTAIVQRRFQI